jgi:hypothetical protein
MSFLLLPASGHIQRSNVGMVYETSSAKAVHTLALTVGKTSIDVGRVAHLVGTINEKFREYRSREASAARLFTSARCHNCTVEPMAKEGRNSLPLSDVAEAAGSIWAVIHNAERIRRLVERTPGLKKNESTMQAFLRGTERVEGLRHYVQHLDNEVRAQIAQEYRSPSRQIRSARV